MSAGMFAVRVVALGMAGMAPGAVRLVIGMGRTGFLADDRSRSDDLPYLRVIG